MASRLYVTRENELSEQGNSAAEGFHPVLVVLGKIISIIFHPLFIPVYISGLLIITPPYFLGFGKQEKMIALLRFFVMYSFFPLVTVSLLKGLGFVDSIFLRSRKERIIPFVACGIFYFWMWYVLRNQPQFAREVIELALGIFIASSLGLMGNIYMKISMHGISMGLMVAFVGYLAMHNSGNLLPWLVLALLVAGLVCTARLLVSDHSPKEVYTGFFIGAISQIIAFNADFLTT